MPQVTYVLNQGQATYTGVPGTYTNSQTNTSVNPIVVNEGILGNYTSLTFYEIRNDDSSNSIHALGSTIYNRQLPLSTTVMDALSNAEDTPAYRVKLPSGITLTRAAGYDYFIVLYSTETFDSDNLNTHKNKTHIAMITDQVQIDDPNDGIEFSPPLRSSVLKDTKFAIFKGPHTDNDTEVVAVAYGLLGNGGLDSDRRYDKYVAAATPQFYFYNDRLDNKNQLDYLTKYQIHRAWDDADDDGENLAIFLTESMGGSVIQDKSPYTYNAVLVDNLYNADKTVADAGATCEEYNPLSFAVEKVNYTFSHTNWSNCFRNGLRSTTNRSGVSLTGPSRYIKHVTSPEKTNIFPYLIEMNVFTTINKSGTYGEARFADPNKIMNNKLDLYNQFKVRDILFSEDFNNEADAALPGTAYYKSAYVVEIRGLEDGQSLAYDAATPNYIVNAGGDKDVIKINNYYYILSTIGSMALDVGTQLFEQDLTVTHYREENSSSWTAGPLQDTSKISDSTYYRRKWSSVTNNLLVDFNLNNNYSSAIQLILKDREYSGTRLTLSTINEKKKLIVPNNIPTTLYQPAGGSTYLDYFSGYFIVDKLIFDGAIEYMEDYFEDGQLKYLISGRDNISKLLGPVVNQNYLYTSDYVYSTDSPIQQTIATNVKFTDTPIGSTGAFAAVGSDHSTWATKGNKIYRSDGALLGVVKTVLGPVITFYEPTRIGYLTTQGFLYINTLLNTNDCDYVISGMGLSTNLENTGSANLTHSSGKGIFFTKGIDYSSNDLSTASATTGTFSLGYDISGIKNISAENSFLFRLANEGATNAYFQQKTISAMTNYDIINISTSDDSVSTITLAPVSPFILGRIDSNSDYDSTPDSYSNSTSMYFLNTQSLNEGGLLNLVNHKNSASENTKKKPVVWKQGNDIYGVPIFRYFNLTKGGKGSLSKMRITGSVTRDGSSGSTKIYNSAYSKSGVGSCSAHAFAYRFKEGFTSGNSPAVIPVLKEYTNVFNTGAETATNDKYTPVSNRGIEPVLGSNWADYNLYDDSIENTKPLLSQKLIDEKIAAGGATSTHMQTLTSDGIGEWEQNNYSFVTPKGYYFSGIFSTGISHIRWLRDKLQITDPKTTQYHIFAPCDTYIDSMNNTNHIGYSTSDFLFTDFGITLKADPSKESNSVPHEHYIGGNDTLKRITSDYASYPITSSSISPKNMRRFSIGRLVECGFDILFNPIDVEHFEHGKTEIPAYTNTEYTIATSSGVGWHSQFDWLPETAEYKKIRLAAKTPVTVAEAVTVDEEYITVSEADWFVPPTWSSGRPDILDYLFNSKGRFVGIPKSIHSTVLDSGEAGSGVFNAGVALTAHIISNPTTTSQAGISYPGLAITGGSGSGSPTLNISENAPGNNIGAVTIAARGTGFVAGDIIIVAKALLDAAHAGGTYSGDLVIRIPTDVIRLYTLANRGSDLNVLAGFAATLDSDNGDVGLEFNNHIRGPLSYLNYTAWGFNEETLAADETSVDGAMAAMADGEYFYALRYNNDYFFHDISQSFKFMGNTNNDYRPRFQKNISLLKYTMNDKIPIAVQDDDTYVYHEMGSTASHRFNLLDAVISAATTGGYETDTSINVGDTYEYTLNSQNNYSLDYSEPRIQTPLVFNSFTLKIADAGDTSAAWTGHPAIGRSRYTNYSPFNTSYDFKQTESDSNARGYYGIMAGHEDTIGGLRDNVTTTIGTGSCNKGETNKVIQVTSAANFPTGTAVAVWNSPGNPRFLGFVTVSGIFNTGVNLLPHVTSLPTITNSSSGTHSAVAISSTSGTGLAATLNITDGGSGAISAITINGRGGGYVAGDSITVTKAHLDALTGSRVYSGDLVISVSAAVVSDITIDNCRTSCITGDTLAALDCANLNYFHPNRVMSMISANYFNLYGCYGGYADLYRQGVSDVADTDAQVGLGIGPFGGGIFVFIEDNTFAGSEIPKYDAGAAFKVGYNIDKLLYSYNGGAGWDGASDQTADTYETGGDDIPFSGWSRYTFCGFGSDFASINSAGGATSNYNNMSFQAVFKPILRISTTASASNLTRQTAVSAASSGIRTITIDFGDGTNNDDSGWNTWVTFTPNLTGYYLVSSSVKANSTSDPLPALSQTYSPNAFDYPGTFADTASIDVFNNLELSVPAYIHQIIDHTVTWNSDGTQKHILTIDNATNINDGGTTNYSAAGEYRLMKFADKCFYDFSPKNFPLYTMSTYSTKHPTENKMWKEIPHLNIAGVVLTPSLDIQTPSTSDTAQLIQGTPKTFTEGRSRHNDGFNSMYVLLDADAETSDYPLVRDMDEIIGTTKKLVPNTNLNVVLNDGNEVLNVDLGVTQNEENTDLKNATFIFSEMKEMVGLVSVGEVFTLEIPTEVTLDATSCKIGTTYNIGMEVDNIINDLMEQNNITYTTSTQSQKYMASPNIKGADLYNALTFVSRFKDLEPRVINNDIKIKLRDDPLDITDITITEGESNVTFSKRNTSTFDNYNTIVVYGDGVRGVKRNSKDIKEAGVKTLEETDLALSTQKEVDDRASQLLTLHSLGTHQIEMDVGIQGVEYLEVGKIINVDYPSEHIPIGKYLILEINHKIGKPLNLVLGYFTKNLDYRIAELIASGKSVNANLRGDKFATTIDAEEYLEAVKIKELRIEISETIIGSGTGLQAIGLGTPLGLSTMLGFVKTTGTTTAIIYEEELI